MLLSYDCKMSYLHNNESGIASNIQPRECRYDILNSYASIERGTILFLLISSGPLQYAHANALEEGRLAWQLAVIMMASRKLRNGMINRIVC